jgi:hypothetical protein
MNNMVVLGLIVTQLMVLWVFCGPDYDEGREWGTWRWGDEEKGRK